MLIGLRGCNKVRVSRVDAYFKGIIFCIGIFYSGGDGALNLLSCQPQVTVTSCFVYSVIRDLESIEHYCINPILSGSTDKS